MFLWKFRNVTVGLASKIMEEKSDQFIQFLKDLAPDQYVLETDAPYFKMKDFRCYGAPCQIFQTAQYLADLKKLPVEIILRDAQQNSVRFYNMLA